MPTNTPPVITPSSFGERYSYPITNTPNDKVDASGLMAEIHASGIVSAALVYVDTLGLMLDVIFSGLLSAADQQKLTTLVSLTTGTPPPSAGLFEGSGNPNGVVVADPGSLYQNDLGGANQSLWVKEVGRDAFGWVAK
jgi:hypothetical protein